MSGGRLMEQEIKDRFEQIDKRISELITMLSVFSGIFTIVFAVFSILIAVNYNSEKDRLLEIEKDLKSEVKTALGQFAQPAKVIVLGKDGRELNNGGEIRAVLETDLQGSKQLVTKIILKNAGGNPSSPLFVKIYTTDPIVLAAGSTDEKDYKYEGFVAPESMKPNILPAGASIDYGIGLPASRTIRELKGRFPALIKVYCGQPESYRLQIYIVLE
jgi:hypothetical protein